MSRSLKRHRWAYPIGMVLIGAHLVISQAEPIKHAYLKSDGPEVLCGLHHNAKRIQHLPVCKNSLDGHRLRRSSPGARWLR